MSNDWVELRDMKQVAEAQWDGWEIETLYMGDWLEWRGREWALGNKYRGRPKQPKTKTVKSECWRCSDGRLFWTNEKIKDGLWKRFPAGDMMGEVAE